MTRIIKRFNVVEEYNPDKIFNTCMRAGLTKEQARLVEKEVRKRLYDGITSREVLKIVKKFIRRLDKGAAARYDLKNSLMRLGPTGYPFEDFVGKLLENYGYKVKLRQLIRGRCALHEIDVLAEKEEEKSKRIIIEAKFRNSNQVYIGLKHVLYTYARFIDLKEGSVIGECEEPDEVWLVCNTKASSEAVRYSECRGLKLITWNHPKGGSLRELIHKKKLFPLTVMSSIRKRDLLTLYDNEIVFVRDLLNLSVQDLEKRFKLEKRTAQRIIDEASWIHNSR